MGFGVRIAPGIRISASSRGIRAGIGPRAARVHVGSGRVGFSSGAGPFTYYTTAGGTRRRTARRGGSRPSLAAYERQLRAAQREQEIAQVATLEKELVSVHLQSFPPAEPPEAPPPQPVDAQEVRKRCLASEREGVGFFNVSARRAAKERAACRAEREIAEETARRAASRAAFQRELDWAWQQLCANQRNVVLAALEDAFEDNEAPAAAVDCEGNRVTILMLFGTAEMIPERKPALTPSGKPTLHKRPRSEVNDFYAQALASNVLATAKEALAVAPGLQAATVVVVRKDKRAEHAGQYVSAVYAGTFSRSRLAAVDWQRIDPLEELLIAPDALLRRKGAAHEIAPIDLRGEPELAAVVEHVRSALSAGAGQEVAG